MNALEVAILLRRSLIEVYIGTSINERMQIIQLPSTEQTNREQDKSIQRAKV